MHPTHYFYTACIGYLLGCLSAGQWVFLILIVISIFFFIYFKKIEIHKSIALLFLLSLGIGGGVTYLHNYTAYHQGSFDYEGKARIYDHRAAREGKHTYWVQLLEQDANIQLTVPIHYEFTEGDVLDISCKITQSDSQDYQRYLYQKGIVGLCYKPQDITFVDTEPGVVTQVRFHILQKLRTYITHPESAFVQGILLGDIRYFPKDILEEFRITGLMHIVALSGYNITLLFLLIDAICTRLYIYPRQRYIYSLIIIILFLLLVGFDSSIVRAAIMGALIVGLRLLGREIPIWKLMVLTATIMCLVGPLSLRYDVGFQLSFAATYGLLVFGSAYDDMAADLPSLFEVRENISATLAATVLTAPIIAWHFQTFSLISFLANVLVLPLLLLLMILGIAVIFSSPIPILAQVIGLATSILARGILWIIKICALVPYAELSGMSSYIVSFIIFIFSLWLYQKKHS
jgi:competence protein ComEC